MTNLTSEVFSETVTLTVKSKPVITAQPKSKTANEGSKATFTVKAENADKYQWYYSTDKGSTWKAVSAAGGKKASYTLMTAARHNGYRYRCKVTNTAGSVYSATVKLTVKCRPEITTQPKNVSVTVGKKASFTVTATGENLSYQWYYSADKGATWKAVSAASGKTAAYSLTAAERHNGNRYRCKVSNSVGSIYSNTVTLTVK